MFAYETIVPKYKNGEDDVEFIWYASLDLKDVPEEAHFDVVKELQNLLSQGVTGLGKTKAFTYIEIAKPTIDSVHKSSSEPKNDTWIITLQTPALLCNPDELESNSAAKLKEAYNKVWQQLSGKHLKLERFFASQSLAGGFYLWKRFQQNKIYQPYLLTDAGSVFVLKATGDNAQKVIKKWLEHGLPLPDWAGGKYKRNNKDGNHWENCPYIHHNGYGEIAVNLDVYPKPQEQEFKAI